MKSYLDICLTVLLTSIFLTSSGQTVINTNKKAGIFPKPVKLKDTTVYKIITQTKDTFYFGSDKKMKIKELDSVLTNILRTKNKSLDILFNGNGSLLMTLSLETTKHRNDTIGVYSIYDPSMLVRFHIEKIYYCDIKSLEVTNYKKVQQYTYHKRLLTKLIAFKDE